MSAARDLSAGQMLGNCRILEQIGQGGMGTVYRAYQPSLERVVAVKVISPVLIGDAVALARFRREAQTVASFRHPHILTVYDFGEQDGFAYLVTEFAAGGTLRDRLGAPLPLSDSVAVLQPVGSALDYAHARGVVHRDVKPGNVLVHADGTLLLSDFGLVLQHEGAQTHLTASGMLLGTPSYMAPEQGLDSQVGPSADIYALGVMAYELLTASVPFSGPTPVSVMLAHIQAPLPPARSRNPNVAAAVELVLARALAKRPADRYPSAAALVAALEAAGTVTPARETVTSAEATVTSVAHGVTPPTDSVTPPTDSVTPREATVTSQVAQRRAPRPLLLAGAAIAALALAGLAAIALVLRPGPAPEPAAAPQWKTLAAAGSIADSSGLAVDHDGFVYVFRDDLRLQKLSPDGQPLAGPWGTVDGPVEFDTPRGLAVDSGGNLYVTESGLAERVQKFAPLGQDWLQSVSRMGGGGSAPGQFSSPDGIAVAEDGTLIVADTENDRIQKLSSTGQSLAVWGGPGSGAGAGQFFAPRGVAVDRQGNVFVADSGNDRIQKLSPTGQSVAQWGTRGAAAGQFSGPSAIAVDADDNILVADAGNGRIQKLSSDGHPLAQWGTLGSGPEQLSAPSGIALDATGTIYVADAGNHRIQKLSFPHS